MSRYLTQDLLAGLVFLVAGLFGLLADDLPLGSASRMGAGFFPYLVSWGLVLVGVATAATGLFRSAPIERIHWKPLILVTVAVSAFGLLVDTIGLVAAAAIMLMLSMYAGREFRFYESVAVAAVLIVLSSVVFVVGFGLPIILFPHF